MTYHSAFPPFKSNSLRTAFKRPSHELWCILSSTSLGKDVIAKLIPCHVSRHVCMFSCIIPAVQGQLYRVPMFHYTRLSMCSHFVYFDLLTLFTMSWPWGCFQRYSLLPGFKIFCTIPYVPTPTCICTHVYTMSFSFFPQYAWPFSWFFKQQFCKYCSMLSGVLHPKEWNMHVQPENSLSKLQVVLANHI